MSYNINQYDIDRAANNNAYFYYDGSEVTQPTTVPSGENVTIKANDGFAFFEESGSEDADGNPPTSVYFRDPYTRQPFYFILSENNTIAQRESDSVSASPQIATEQQEIVVSGTNNVYLIDGDILSQVNQQRFTQTSTDSPIIDYGQYILSVLNIPSSLNSEIIKESVPINLANRSLTVSAQEISTDKIEFDLGEISFPETNGNSLDYLNVVFKLHLPFSETKEIEPIYIVGATIKIKYTLDCYNGSAVVNIFSDKFSESIPFMTFSVDMGINIPYYSVSYSNATIDNQNIEFVGDNNLLTPYLEVIDYNSDENYDYYYIPVEDEDLISNQSGYIEVDNAELSFNAIGGEKEKIINILSNGVIIND